uniref:MKI67 FHA domain-interacting nucleolar phosphoprotein-like protein n=1 Tax=Ascaris suum TaxID=6253 RepID=F1L7M4_ASCSU
MLDDGDKTDTEETDVKQASTSLAIKRRVHRQNLPPLGDPEARSKVIKIRHIPYGFFEKELLKYFRQFGKVRRVRVARSVKTGNHKGWAFVSFTDENVAQIAAETMHGYLMFDKRLICKVLKNREVPNCMRSGKCLIRPPIRGARARKHTRLAGKHKSGIQEEASERRILRRLKKKSAQLAAMGFDYSFDIGSLEHRWIKKEEPKEEMPEGVGETPPKEDSKGDAVKPPLMKKKKKKNRPCTK